MSNKENDLFGSMLGTTLEKHDIFLKRQKSTARIYEMFEDKPKETGKVDFDPTKEKESCSTCKNGRKCSRTRAFIKNGVASIGIEDANFKCGNYKPREGMKSTKEINSLLKSFKHQFRQ